MIARTRNVMRRLDRWLLLHAPMLWRTRLLHLLLLLSLAVIAAVPFVQTSIEKPSEALGLGSDTVFCWWWRYVGSLVVLMVWVRTILIKPVGELAPHRHVVTVAAVAIGSYLWLVTPSLLAYPQINTIKRVGPDDQVLNEDLVSLSRYSNWDCVPPDVWDNASELEELRNVLARYGYRNGIERGPIDENRPCHLKGNFPLRPSGFAFGGKKTIETIRDARSFESNYTSENQFYPIGIGRSWWLAAAALGIGILTAILSYPPYVWRRTFLWR